LKVIAEGVETAEQAAILKNKGCDEVQGYLYGRPMPLEEFTRYAAKWASTRSTAPRRPRNRLAPRPICKT
jgi:EAL domain-containing protein (putative c-di-GMP-specific phosphodiesterase class I)